MNRFAMIREALQEVANPKPKVKKIKKRKRVEQRQARPVPNLDISRFSIGVPGSIETRIRRKYTEKIAELGFNITSLLRIDYLEHRSMDKSKYLYFVFAQLNNEEYIAFNLWGKINTSVGGMKVITRSPSAPRVRRNYLTKIASKEHQSDAYESVRHFDAASEQ